MVTAALDTLGACRPVVTSILVRVEVSVWLRLPKFEVFSVVKEDKERSALLLGVTWEVWKVAVRHA